MQFFAFLAALARSLGRVATLPIDLVGRSVYGIGRTLMPAAESLCRSALDGANWALASSRDLAITAIAAPFALLAGGSDGDGGGPYRAAPEERGSGWMPTTSPATYGVSVFAYACAVAAGRTPPGLTDVPPRVRVWAKSLTPAECVVLSRVMPDRIERHVEADGREDRLPGVRAFGLQAARTPSPAAVATAKAKAHIIDESLPVYRPAM